MYSKSKYINNYIKTKFFSKKIINIINKKMNTKVYRNFPKKKSTQKLTFLTTNHFNTPSQLRKNK